MVVLIMRKFIYYSKILVLKIAALILWSVLILFNYAFQLVTVIYRFVAIPITMIGLLVIVVTIFDNGFSLSLLNSLLTFAFLGALYFLLPSLLSVFVRLQMRVKSIALSPVIIRSPIKFTL